MMCVQFIVKRKGLDLTEYGLVDAQAVKRQRLEPDVKTPVTLQQWRPFLLSLFCRVVLRQTAIYLNKAVPRAFCP